MCIDSPAKRSDLHKPLGLYPCHKQGGNQVNELDLLALCCSVTRKLIFVFFDNSNLLFFFIFVRPYLFCFCNSIGFIAKLVKFVVMKRAWIMPDVMSFYILVMVPKEISIGLTIMRFVEDILFSFNII